MNEDLEQLQRDFEQLKNEFDEFKSTTVTHLEEYSALGIPWNLLSPNSNNPGHTHTEFFKITSASYLLSNSANETIILTTTLPANTLSTNRGIYGRFSLNIRCDAGAARTIQFKINYGSGNKAVSEELPASANVKGHLDVYVIPQASESSQKLLIGFMAQEEGAATDLLFASASNYDAEVSPDSIDSTVDQTLSVTAELYSAQAGHLVRSEGGFFKLI